MRKNVQIINQNGLMRLLGWGALAIANYEVVYISTALRSRPEKSIISCTISYRESDLGLIDF
jgi:hypothetical protein